MLKTSILTTSILFAISATAAQGQNTKIKSINLSDSLRIVGGTESIPHFRAYQASIQSSDGYHLCGGSIVAKNLILTAAHCLEGVDGESPNLQVRVGAHSLTDGSGQAIKVAKTYTNLEYPNLAKDIAILKLEQEITDSNAKVIQLADQAFFDANINNGTNLVVSGWGALTQGGHSPDKLMEVTVPYVSNDICNSSAAYDGQIQATEMCAGFQAGGKDSCQGDSGGPLVYQNNNHFVQVGVVSWGDGCAVENKYGVYGDVAKLRSWIDSAMAGNEVASGLVSDYGDDIYDENYSDNNTNHNQTNYFAIQESISYSLDEEQLELILDIPAGVNVLYIATKGGEGDVDITVERTEVNDNSTNLDDNWQNWDNSQAWHHWQNWGDIWNTENNLYSSENIGNNETLIIDQPQAGEWVISFSDYLEFSDVELTIFSH